MVLLSNGETLLLRAVLPSFSLFRRQGVVEEGWPTSPQAGTLRFGRPGLPGALVFRPTSAARLDKVLDEVLDAWSAAHVVQAGVADRSCNRWELQRDLRLSLKLANPRSAQALRDALAAAIFGASVGPAALRADTPRREHRIDLAIVRRFQFEQDSYGNMNTWPHEEIGFEHTRQLMVLFTVLPAGPSVADATFAELLASGAVARWSCSQPAPRCAAGTVPQDGRLDAFLAPTLELGAARQIDPLSLRVRIGGDEWVVSRHQDAVVRYIHASPYLGRRPGLRVPPRLAGQPVAVRYDEWTFGSVDCPNGP